MLPAMLMVTMTITVLGNALPQQFNFEERGTKYKVTYIANAIKVNIDCHMDRIQVAEFNETHGPYGLSEPYGHKIIVIKECRLPDASLQNVINSIGIKSRIKKLLILDSSVASNAFSGFTKCDMIQLQNSSFSISSNSFTGATDLRALAIEQSNLTDLVDTFLSQHYDLRLLDLENNFITEVTNSFFERLTNLSDLNLNNNRLTSLPDNFLRTIPSLKYVYFNSNPLKVISSNSMSGSNILRLFLNDNTVPLTLAPRALSDMPHLRYMHLKNCSIQELPADLLMGSDNIEEMDLSYNRIQELPGEIFVNKSKLNYLDLNNNELHKLSAANFAILPSMNTLYIQDNKITEISGKTFASMTMLWSLMINNNSIHSVSPDAFPTSLHFLHLWNNKLTTLETTRLPSLYLLTLSNNLFSSIPPRWRENYPALAKADLQNNSFTRFTAADFAALPEKSAVSLSDNEIVSIQIDQNTSLPTVLSLDRAPLRCDCWMHAFASRLQNETNDVYNACCAEPVSLNGTQLSKVPLEDLVCHLESCPDTCSCTVIPEIRALKVKCGKQLTEEQLKTLEYLRQKHYNDITDNVIFVIDN